MSHLHQAWRKLASWRNQPFSAEGKVWTLGEVSGGKLYHGSTVDLPIGTVLESGHSQNFDKSSGDSVSITSLRDRAAYWAKEAGGPVFVYEIEPLGEVVPWRVAAAERGQSFQIYEARVPQARIVGKV